MRALQPVLRRRYAYLAKDVLTPLIEVLNVGRESSDGDLDEDVLSGAVDPGRDRRDGDNLALAPHASRRLTDLREQMFQLALQYHHQIEAVQTQET